jgi:hypothetical protein
MLSISGESCVRLSGILNVTLALLDCAHAASAISRTIIEIAT